MIVLLLGFSFLSEFLENGMALCYLLSWHDVFTGIACCCWRLGNWDEFEEGRLEENAFVIHRGWGHREKGDHSRFPTTELGMRLG